MSVALKQSITAWVRVNAVSYWNTSLLQCYCSWQLSLAWGALPWENRTFQDREGALPCQQHQGNCLKTRRLQDPPILGAAAGSGVGYGEALPWDRRLSESRFWSRRDLRVPHTKWEWQDRVSCAVECSSPFFSGKGCYSHSQMGSISLPLALSKAEYFQPCFSVIT